MVAHLFVALTVSTEFNQVKKSSLKHSTNTCLNLRDAFLQQPSLAHSSFGRSRGRRRLRFERLQPGAWAFPVARCRTAPALFCVECQQGKTRRRGGYSVSLQATDYYLQAWLCITMLTLGISWLPHAHSRKARWYSMSGRCWKRTLPLPTPNGPYHLWKPFVMRHPGRRAPF